MAKITFKGIGIQDLGPFRERQYLDLRVRSGRPVILVKALNGSGKTTLLTCLQIALYGSKAFGSRTAEYEQLLRGLQRADAKGHARIDLDLRVEAHGDADDLTISREWSIVGSKVAERLMVCRKGTQDHLLTDDWDDYLDAILPAELIQLFLFDGEKIESLANPKTLPDMLRRATEVFLGIGGIDSLSKDLIAVERRALLRTKETLGEYEHARQELVELERQHSSVSVAIEVLTQSVGSAQQLADMARKTYERFASEGQRAGLAAFERAAEIRSAEQQAIVRVAEAEHAVREALADPWAPLASLGSLWQTYGKQWADESRSRYAQALLQEITRRDKRVLRALDTSLSKSALGALRDVLASETREYRQAGKLKPVLVAAEEPSSVEARIDEAVNRYQQCVGQLESARSHLVDAQRRMAAIPQGEHVAELLKGLQEQASRMAEAEGRLESIKHQLAESHSNKAHLETRLAAARLRMSKDFRGQAQDAKAIAAGQRARSVLAVFKDQLLASKAKWLSNMITNEFRGLMRKQRLVSRVCVDPTSYEVSIVGGDGHELPLERLSAGERQLLAVSVLSALIRERKGHFPVAVDTPLARLDGTHRQALIRRFFAKISHQVLVLSTDEEVEGATYDEMARLTSNAYALNFSDEGRHTTVGPLFDKEEQRA
ncbi:MAG: DNA sulfur modification protein DndD [Burkholderiales bacterium]|nr:DNA sulfur modification protein DndD [Burkholderiales bacterium]